MEVKSLKNLSWSVSFQVTVVILIVSVNLLWFLPTVSSLRQSISKEEKLTVEKNLARMEAFFDDKEIDIEAPSRYITAPLKSPENERIVRKILKEEYFINVSLADIEGNEVLKFSKDEFVSDKDLKNISGKSDFKKAVQTGETSWSDIRISGTFEPFMSVNIPISSSKGDIIGVLSGEFSLQSLFKGLAAGVGGREKLYVTDKSGLLINHPNSSLVLKNTNFLDRRVVKDTISSMGIAVADNDTYTYKNEEGIEVLSAGGYFEETELAVVYEEPKSGAFSSLRRIEIFFAVAFVFISLMVFVLRRANARADRARIDLEAAFTEQKKLLGLVEKSRGELEVANKDLEKRRAEIKVKVAELEKFQKLTIDRELKMIELKKENEELKKHLTSNI